MTGSVTAARSGARVVELLMPFEYKGQRFDSIVIGPIVLDNTMRWKRAEYKEWFDMMVEVSTVNGRPIQPELLRQLRYPDADRVIENFFQLLPSEIKQTIADGLWPQQVTREEERLPEMPEGTSASDEERALGLQPGNAADTLNVDE